MIDKVNPFPTMKDSGILWLGQVPAHWEIKRGKSLFCCIDVRSTNGEEELLTVSSDRGVVPRSTANVTMFKAESYVGYKLCWPGDLVINSLWAWARGLGVSRHHGIVSSAYGVYRLRPRYKGYNGFIHELVRSSPFNWELQVRSKGIWISRLQLTSEAFLEAPFPLPPANESSSIVRFLDYMDRRIRKYIRAKQKLIKLLEEQKQVVIHQAVTGRIDVRTGKPYSAYKPSGVEWLGEVPEHWEVSRLKTLCSMKSGDGITAMSIETTGEYPVYGGNGVRGFTSRYTHSGDFVLVGRQGALCGNVHLARGQFWASEHAIVTTLKNNDCLEWLAALLRTMNLNQYSIAAAQPGLAVERVLNLGIPVPTKSEQHGVAVYIAEVTAPLTKAVERFHQEVKLLREYRTRLIADVVTGKVDVPEAVKGFPEEVDLAEEDFELDDEETDLDQGESDNDDEEDV